MAEPGKPIEPSLADFFKPLGPNEKPPPPPRWLALWSSQVSTGLLAGTVYGGYQGLLEARHPIGPLDAPAGALSPFTNRRHRVSAYFVRGSILHGARIGSFVGLLSATSLIADSFLRADDTEEDAPTDPRALAAGAASTCALYGGAVGGGMAGLQAGAFGLVAGGAAGWVQQKLAGAVTKLEREQIPETENAKDATATEVESAQPEDEEGAYTAVGDVVQWLEAGQKERQKGASDTSAPSSTSKK